MRQMRFNSEDDIDINVLKQYVLEAMSNSEAGLEVKPKRNLKPIVIPEELKTEFSKNEKLEYRFNEFTISKKREFCEYIALAKREGTKLKRIEKIIPMILDKVGLNDKYRNC